MAPSRAYLFLEAQPPMKMPNVFSPVIPMMNSAPTFTRPRKLSSPNGTKATTASAGTRRTTGAMLNTGRSAPSGTRSSLVISLTKSASGWKRPNGPHLLGPSRAWKRAMTRLSNHV